MEDTLTAILISIEDLKGQMKRFAADVESEKTVRRDRNNDIDKRLRDLENDKIQRDTTNKLVKALLVTIGTLTGSLITLVIAYINHVKK